MSYNDNILISLNIGGTIMTTHKKILFKSKYFKKIFENIENFQLYFVDYSPTIFDHVLSYLRDPLYLFPEKYLHALIILKLTMMIYYLMKYT